MSNTEKEEVELESNRGIELPKGITMDMLNTNWDVCKTQYSGIRKRMILLDAVDKGKLWEKLCKKFPQYQITPDTNYTNYIKENILASIYTVGKSASIIAQKEEDVEVVDAINKVIDTMWSMLSVPMYQQKAGERAALLNLGITQVGWNQDLVGGTKGAWFKGDVVMKNVDPLKFFRDPYSTDLDDALYCIQHEEYSITSLEGIKEYKSAMKDYKDSKMFDTSEDLPEYVSNRQDPSATSRKDNVRLIIHWIKLPKESEEGGFDFYEIHTINNEFILKVVEKLKPAMFPFALLYCNEPGGELVGISEPDKTLQSATALNMMNAIIATYAYKAQRPPRFISVTSGINIANFAKYGNDPDKVFVVNGDASRAVHYVTFPELPSELKDLVGMLDHQIKAMSGIDEKYTGKDTGSITTTGGIESMLAQSTMRDTTKINNYEAYAKRLSRLVVKHFIEYADKRAYLIPDKIGNSATTYEIDFPNIDSDIEFQFALHISNYLPKSRASMAQAATTIMEKSMQFADPTGQTPNMMEPEEWLQNQEFPNKEIMLARMKIARSASKSEDIVQAITMFSELLQQGASPEEALQLIVEQLEGQSDPEGGSQLGSVGDGSGGAIGGSPQAKQMG